jgi:ORF6N domain
MNIVPIESIEQKILNIRSQKVMIDSDIAQLYGIETKALNQAVKRNINRFPSDFMFELTREEMTEVVTNCDHLQKLKFSKTVPKAFSEQGVYMLATIINSQKAIDTTITIMRTFTKMREFATNYNTLASKLQELEKIKHQTVCRSVDASKYAIRPNGRCAVHA